MKKERYNNINGLRAYSAILIILVHVMQNTSLIEKNSSLYIIISSFGWLVFLFMIISGFSMCCGYYDSVLHNKISVVDFYKKRYIKTLPFFSLIVIIDLILSHNLNSLYEGFADMTLVYGLLPNPKISVIGVGWTLGVIFVFYLLFPFFVFLIRDKKNSLISLFLSIIFCFISITYFFTDKFVVYDYISRKNIIYCAPFFLIGGVIYLYRKEIMQKFKKYKNYFFVMFILLNIVFFVFNNLSSNEYFFYIIIILMYSSIMIFSIINKNRLLDNKVTSSISEISMEMYLSHMLIFRIIEKLRLNNIINNNLILFITMFVTTLIGTIIFCFLYKKILQKWRNYFENKKNFKEITNQKMD